MRTGNANWLSRTDIRMIDYIKTPNGYLRASEIESFAVVDSHGSSNHGQVRVTMKSGTAYNTGMFEGEFLKAYRQALGDAS